MVDELLEIFESRLPLVTLYKSAELMYFVVGEELCRSRSGGCGRGGGGGEVAN